mgnify:CR=1 FL=1
MRLFLQRVRSASVTSEGRLLAEIGPGLLVLCGFGAADGPDLPESRVWGAMLAKMLDLRVFPDDAGKMNLGLRDAGGGLLAVSQFTLYADWRKGRRPSFTGACPPEIASPLFDRFRRDVTALLPGKSGFGEFGADMDVSLVNWGPVSLMLDSEAFSGT